MTLGNQAVDRPLRLVLANFHDGWGGQAAYVLNLARGLKSAGHQVTVVCPAGSKLAQRAAQAEVPTFTACRLRRGLRPLEFWREVQAFAGLLHETKADIVHTHGPPECWRAALACRLGRLSCRHVRTKHNSYAVRAHPANRWLYRHGIHRLVVVAAALKPLLGKLLPPERIDVLHAPVADCFFDPPSGADFRAEMGLGAEAPLIGVVARLSPDKGQADVLRAMVLMRERCPGITAIFAGGGPDRERLAAMAGELGLAGAARFLRSRSDVPAITAALDAAVLASTGCDASSTVVKEALAAGVPVVATDVGGIREIIEDGVTGRVVPPGDPQRLAEAIMATLSDRNSSRQAAGRGREVMRTRFSESAFTAGQLDIYRRVLLENNA